MRKMFIGNFPQAVAIASSTEITTTKTLKIGINWLQKIKIEIDRNRGPTEKTGKKIKKNEENILLNVHDNFRGTPKNVVHFAKAFIISK